MKRYFTFRYACYYPCGGMEDFVGDFDTLEEAIEAAGAEEEYEDGHILDTGTGERIDPWAKGEEEATPTRSTPLCFKSLEPDGKPPKPLTFSFGNNVPLSGQPER